MRYPPEDGCLIIVVTIFCSLLYLLKIYRCQIEKLSDVFQRFNKSNKPTVVYTVIKILFSDGSLSVIRALLTLILGKFVNLLSLNSLSRSVETVENSRQELFFSNKESVSIFIVVWLSTVSSKFRHIGETWNNELLLKVFVRFFRTNICSSIASQLRLSTFILCVNCSRLFGRPLT